jgi:hypothetical protein
MKTISKLKTAAAATALAALVACGPGLAPSGVSIVVRRPPPRRVEVRTIAPGPGYVWISGYYGWEGSDYVWHPGEWRQPPQNQRTWVPGHWARARGGYYWVEGRWR